MRKLCALQVTPQTAIGRAGAALFGVLSADVGFYMHTPGCDAFFFFQINYLLEKGALSSLAPF